MRTTTLLIGIMAFGFAIESSGAAGDPVYETCPEASDVGDNVVCYPVHFISKTEVHPEGIPVIGYLFVPTDAPAEPLPVIVMAHGSGSMYSSGNHNKGLNSKHLQWVRQYTSERKIPTFHVSSFHSRYLLPDTASDQRILDWENIPAGIVGGDDYRATSAYHGADTGSDPHVTVAFDPEDDGYNEGGNSGAGVSEVTERAYDADAAWDFLAGIRKGRFISNSRNKNDDPAERTLGAPMAGTGFIQEIVSEGITIDHERIFFSGTSHGGQTAMTAAHAPRATSPENPMGSAGVGGERYAAFFDYYGGCGLYGAYGGTSGSTWEPYAPFLMLHGENDDIWKDQTTGSVRDQWMNSECKPRIDAAKANASYNEFLGAVIYAGANHSFDGTKRDDFTDETNTAGHSDFDEWAAKIHANYRLQLEIMDSVGRIVSAARNSKTALTLEELGFSDANPYFSTYPLTPNLPPVIKDTQLSGFQFTTSLGDMTSVAVFSFLPLFEDPFDVFELGCATTIDPVLPDNISYDGSCTLTIALDAGQRTSVLGGTPIHFQIPIDTDQGRTFLPLTIEAKTATTAQLRKHAPGYFLPANAVLEADISSGSLSMDLSAFAWTDLRIDNGYLSRHTIAINPGGYTTNSDRFLETAGTPADGLLRINHRKNGSGKHYVITAATGMGDDYTAFTAGGMSVGLADGYDQSLSSTDFTTSYVALATVSQDLPPTLSELDAEWNTVSPGDGGSGSSGDGSSGDDGSGGDGSGGDGSGNGGSGNGGSGNGGSGGGAFFWLLPLLACWRLRSR